MKFSSVAWVPDNDSQRDWETSAALAAEWVDQRSKESGASAVLVTNALNHLSVPSLEMFERRHARTSRLAGRGRVAVGDGPVLSYVPQAEDLEFAMNLARNSYLAVVEGSLFPLRGWAAWFEAHDLVGGDTTAPLNPAIREGAKRLSLHGSNGFSDPFGKQQAHSIVARLREQADLDTDLLIGAVFAAGVRPRGIKNLQRLIARH